MILLHSSIEQTNEWLVRPCIWVVNFYLNNDSFKFNKSIRAYTHKHLMSLDEDV